MFYYDIGPGLWLADGNKEESAVGSLHTTKIELGSESMAAKPETALQTVAQKSKKIEQPTPPTNPNERKYQRAEQLQKMQEQPQDLERLQESKVQEVGKAGTELDEARKGLGCSAFADRSDVQPKSKNQRSNALRNARRMARKMATTREM